MGFVLLAGGVLSSGIITKTFIKSTKVPSPPTGGSGQAQTGMVKVDVSGAVVNPGVYSLPSDSRMEDALKAAGGVTQSADPAYLTKNINLAQKLSDGIKIYVPQVAEQTPEAASVMGENVADMGQNILININSASAVELDKLPGVGPARAQKIIDARPYSGIEELVTKKAVTGSVYDEIKNMVSVY